MSRVTDTDLEGFERRYPIAGNIDWAEAGRAVLEHCATIEAETTHALDEWERGLQTAGAVLVDGGGLASLELGQLEALGRLMGELGFGTAEEGEHRG